MGYRVAGIQAAFRQSGLRFQPAHGADGVFALLAQVALGLQ
jgi:hypothetical protein